MQKTITEVEQTEVQEMQEEMESSIQVEGSKIEANGLHAALDTMAEGFDVTGFKCPTCGLAHMHSTNKHRATDSFDMGSEESASYDTNPNCHCFVHEASRRADEMGIDKSKAQRIAEGAPVPDSLTQELNAKFGGV